MVIFEVRPDSKGWRKGLGINTIRPISKVDERLFGGGPTRRRPTRVGSRGGESFRCGYENLVGGVGGGQIKV